MKKLIKGTNDLKTACPEILGEWDYKRNLGIDPNDVLYCSSQKVWWVCKEGHNWETQIRNRTKLHSGCPYCSGREPIQGETDLETLFPEISKEWNYEKNGNLTPKMVTKASSKKAWWICKEGHEWKSTIHTRTRLKCGCPYCSNHKVLKGWNDLESSGSDVVKEWNYKRNKELTPDKVTKNSEKKVWWICENGHEYQTTVAHRVSDGSGCPYCSGNKLLSGFNDLATKYPNLMKEWDYNKNKDINPTQISPSYKNTVWWRCSIGHEWKASPSNRSSKNSGCPYCSNKKILRGYNDLESLRPNIAKEWAQDLNGNLHPYEFSFRSGKKVWWRCNLGHTWESTIDNRVHGKKCPTCCGRKILSGFNDLATTHPQLVCEWSTKNGNITPKMIGAGSNKKAWWECSQGHTWYAVISSRALNGNGCPICAGWQDKSMPELTIYHFIKEQFQDAISGDRTLGREIDIYIPSLSKGMEYDGRAYHSDENHIKKDIEKNDLFLENGIKILHVREKGCPNIPELISIYREDNYKPESLTNIINWIFENFLHCERRVSKEEVKEVMTQKKVELQQKVTRIRYK